MSEMDEIIEEFVIECHEGLDQLDLDFVALEQHPDDRDALAGVFRTIHTIKGTAGFLGFSRLEALTHVGESLMSRLRDGELRLDHEITDALLALVDAVRRILANIENTGQEGEGSDEPLVETLSRLRDLPATQLAELDTGSEPDTGNVPVPGEAAASPADEPAIAADVDTASHMAASNVRVDVGLLDRLMNLVGELVLARNQVLQFTSSQSNAAFLATSQRLNLITTELQEGVMKTRMQPIEGLWSKFPRVVRDLASVCNKQVRLDMEGRETELDRSVLEAIKDPLTHIVRNSIDHGIEAPDVRIEAGKPPEGRILLRAFHEGGLVNIEIVDDGAGINVEKVKAKAIERGLVSLDQIERMGERELANLVFLPGFSTAEAVTNVSGRGVGMDVVKTNVEKIGGTLDMVSRPGLGTTLRIKIPLTLAIIPALVVTSGGDRYAIPQVSLLELVRLEAEQARTAIETIHGAPVYRLRGNLLPLVSLNEQLGIDGPPLGSATGDAVVSIVVLQADDQQFGLVVDEINDGAEIVVKPLGRHLKGIPCFAGATIMGDGKIALILDVLGIAQTSNVVSELRDQSLHGVTDGVDRDATDRTTFLVVGIGDKRRPPRESAGERIYRRVAIPLDEVARLEEFSRTSIERAGEQDVVQYRNEILTLVPVNEMLGETEPDETHDIDDQLQVVVHTQNGRSIGLVVDAILDIIEETVTAFKPSDAPGIAGSAVLQGKVTDLLDIEATIRAVDATFFHEVVRGEPVGAGV